MWFLPSNMRTWVLIYTHCGYTNCQTFSGQIISKSDNILTVLDTEAGSQARPHQCDWRGVQPCKEQVTVWPWHEAQRTGTRLCMCTGKDWEVITVLAQQKWLKAPETPIYSVSGFAMKPGKQEEGKKIHVLKTIMVFNICKDDQTLKYHLSSVILSVKKKKRNLQQSHWDREWRS